MKKILFIGIILLGFIATTRPQNLSVFMTNYTASPVMLVGGWDSLTSGSVTGAATMDINFSSYYNTYNYFYLFVSTVPTTNNVDLTMLTSTDGSTFDNSSGNYNWHYNYGDGSSAGQPDAVLKLAGNCGNAAGEHTDGTIIFMNPSNASYWPLFRWQVAESDAGSTNAPITGVGARLSAQVLKALRLYYTSGNITGSYKLFGSR